MLADRQQQFHFVQSQGLRTVPVGVGQTGNTVFQQCRPLAKAQPTQPQTPEPGLADQERQFARFQSDAPACDNCGALTVRCGTCYRCFNCGNSMGCS